MLNQWIVAIIEINGMDQARIRSKLHKFSALYTVHCQWFFTDDMLAGGENIFVDLVMQVIRRAIMNNTDLRIRQKFTVITVRLLNAQKIYEACVDR